MQNHARKEDVHATSEKELNLPPKLPTSIKDYLQSMGPGLIMAMAFLGTGDLISSSVSGANYGYTLMWTIIIGLVARFFMISAIAKYVLLNKFGDTSILQGFSRVWNKFPLILAISTLIFGVVIQMSMLKASSISLYNLTGQVGGEWAVFFWGVVIMGLVTFLVTRKNSYKFVEVVAKLAAAIIVLSFLYAFINLDQINFTGMIQGMVFSIPENHGSFDAIYIAIATIGGVGGSIMNLMYPYFMEDKGWKGPEYRKVQKLDLLSGLIPMLAINLLIWIVAAETIRGTGLTISTEYDLANMMELAVGPFGPTILWVSLFFIAFSSITPQARGLTKMVYNGIHLSTKRGNKFKTADEDPLFNVGQVGLFLLLPIIINLPNAPSLVHINVFGTSVITAITMPIIMFGVILMTSSSRYMLKEYKNKLWEILLLTVIAGIGVWSMASIVNNLFKTITGL